MTRQILELPPQQKRVAQLLSEGNTVSEVADVMGLSRNTISTHLKRLCKKLNARSAIHVAVLWVKAHG